MGKKKGLMSSKEPERVLTQEELRNMKKGCAIVVAAMVLMGAGGLAWFKERHDASVVAPRYARGLVAKPEGVKAVEKAAAEYVGALYNSGLDVGITSKKVDKKSVYDYTLNFFRGEYSRFPIIPNTFTNLVTTAQRLSTLEQAHRKEIIEYNASVKSARDKFTEASWIGRRRLLQKKPRRSQSKAKFGKIRGPRRT